VLPCQDNVEHDEAGAKSTGRAPGEEGTRAESGRNRSQGPSPPELSESGGGVGCLSGSGVRIHGGRSRAQFLCGRDQNGSETVSFVFDRGSRSDAVKSRPRGKEGSTEGLRCLGRTLDERGEGGRELEPSGATRAAGEGSGEGTGPDSFATSGPFNDLPRSEHGAGEEDGVVAGMALRWPPPRSATARAGLQSVRCFFLSFPLPPWFCWRLPCFSMRR